MKMIPTRVHGILDYAVGVLLILAPYLFGFATGGPEQILPTVLGGGAIAYSLLTRYELGLVKAIPMPAHLALDVVGGLVLALSPWVLRFAETIWWPHLLIGVTEILVALLTRTTPARLTATARPR